MKRPYSILGACILLIVQGVALETLREHWLGVLVSNTAQLALGALCVWESFCALRRSRGGWHHFWQWMTATFGIWVGAQLLGVYIDQTGNRSLDALDDLLFSLSGIPFGMLLFLDSDQKNDEFDRLHLIDFLQVCGFWFCVYLYFSEGQKPGVTNWGPFGWSTSLIFNGVLALSFAFRAAAARSKEVRQFFGLMALYLLLSGLADSYFSLAANKVESGSWLDLVWSGLLVIPLFTATRWNAVHSDSASRDNFPQYALVNQFFPLVYPFVSLLLIAQMQSTKRALESCIGCVIFVAVGLRMLIIQRRLIRAQEVLRFEATHDVLTGLANRGAILACLEREIERHKRTGQPVGVIMADADHFKRINDVYGHIVGDQVLRAMTRRMIATLRSYDWAGRYGGEEFLMVVPDCDAAATFATAERLRESVAKEPITTSAGPISVTVSMGLVAATKCSWDLDSSTVLRLADEALYSAKNKGRNRVEGATAAGLFSSPDGLYSTRTPTGVGDVPSRGTR